MSLSAWEQQALDSIEDELVGADPKLASLQATFARLASGEEMPVCEKIRKQSLYRGNVRWPARRLFPRLGLQRTMLRGWCPLMARRRVPRCPGLLEGRDGRQPGNTPPAPAPQQPGRRLDPRAAVARKAPGRARGLRDKGRLAALSARATSRRGLCPLSAGRADRTVSA